MRQEFEQIINRLGWIRSRLDEYIQDKGGITDEAESILEYVNCIGSIPDLGNLRNGIEVFAGNTEIERLPECFADATQVFTSMYKFAKGCTALKSVPRLYTDNVTTFVYAFYGCTALEEIDGLLTDSATTLGECFHNCSSLVAINSPLDVSSIVSQLDTTFTGCANLEYLRFSGSLCADIWLSGAPKLTLDSLLSVIDSLADLNQLAVPTTKKITFGARNKAKLSAAQLALVTDKGWTLG